MINKSINNIEKVSIPDDDMVNWIKTLRTGGFSEEEIDSMMMRLNKSYFNLKGRQSIEGELEKIKKEWLEKNKQTMSSAQEEYFRKGLELRLKVEK